MTTIAIDTLATMRKLEKAGFETVQAEAVAETVAEVVGRQGDDLATKADLKVVEKSLRQEIAGVRGEITGVRGEVAGVRQDVVGLRWTFGIVAGFVVALNLVIFGFMYQSNQQINQQITQLTQQVGHLSGVVEQWSRQ